MSLGFIEPDWPASTRVKAYVTQRTGGVSRGGYESLNLAMHVEDTLADVIENRARLSQALSLPAEPLWLNQVHGVNVLDAAEILSHEGLCDADASMTYQTNHVLAILTADCLPIFLTDRSGSFVSAIHAGWRGLVDGIIPEAVRASSVPAEKVLAWVGPGIGPNHYEVSSEVRDVFLMSGRADYFHFRPSQKTGHWMADLAGIALWQLDQLNVCWIGGGHWCTYQRQDQFFSYRRDGAQTGRMASLIWLAN